MFLYKKAKYMLRNFFNCQDLYLFKSYHFIYWPREFYYIRCVIAKL